MSVCSNVGRVLGAAVFLSGCCMGGSSGPPAPASVGACDVPSASVCVDQVATDFGTTIAAAVIIGALCEPMHGTYTANVACPAAAVVATCASGQDGYVTHYYSTGGSPFTAETGQAACLAATAPPPAVAVEAPTGPLDLVPAILANDHGVFPPSWSFIDQEPGGESLTDPTTEADPEGSLAGLETLTGILPQEFHVRMATSPSAPDGFGCRFVLLADADEAARVADADRAADEEGRSRLPGHGGGYFAVDRVEVGCLGAGGGARARELARYYESRELTVASEQYGSEVPAVP
jgi:hypothetical protein